MLVELVFCFGISEWPRGKQEVEEDDTGVEHIYGPAVVALGRVSCRNALLQLRCQEAASAHDGMQFAGWFAGRVLREVLLTWARAAVERAAETQVSNHEVELLVKEHVCDLDVPVCEATVVQGLDALHQLVEELEGVEFLEFLGAPEEVSKVKFESQFRDNVHDLFLLDFGDREYLALAALGQLSHPAVKDLEHILMANGGKKMGLELEDFVCRLIIMFEKLQSKLFRRQVSRDRLSVKVMHFPYDGSCSFTQKLDKLESLVDDVTGTRLW